VKPSRRQFIKRGLVGGGLLLAAGTLPFAFRTTALGRRPRRELRLLSLEEHAVLAAAAARLVPGDGAGPAWPRADAVDCAGKIDALLATCHPDVGSDFRKLLRLFESGFLGTFIAASPRPFTRATPEPSKVLMPGMYALNEAVMCRKKATGKFAWNWNVGLAAPKIPHRAAGCD